MLVLSRKVGERIQIDSGITITVVEVHGNRVRIGIEAPRQVNIRRQELPAPSGAESAAQDRDSA
jgi:carbon storage regulator